MESESSHSLASPSETPNATESETRNECISRKRGRKCSTSKPPVNPQQRSKYWEHCDKGSRKLDNGGVQNLGICKYCKTEIPVNYESTSGLINHLVKRQWGEEIVVDNASSNDTTIDYLKKRMKSESTLLFEGKYLHLRCACHILNLIVKDGLKELNASIKSIRNVVLFIHSSPSRLSKFREFATLAKFASTSTVPMDVKTRWNATYKMLDVALKYRRVFERMSEEWLPFMNYFREKDEKGKKRVGPPVVEDWENANAFVYFLQKFYEVTLELSASKNPTSQLIYQSMIALQIEIEKKSNDDSDPILKKVAIAMKLKFDKYWGN
ncbi:hypothetical protein OROGR_030259 [Orobanche gracilis]